MLKIAAKYKSIFTAFFLACFACASISLAFHSFTHQAVFAQESSFATSTEQFLVAEPSFFAKNFSKNHKSSNHDLSHCSLCFFSGINNNAIFSAAIIFVAAIFYLFLTWRKFDRVKLAYLSSSFSSRAPPFVS